MDILSNLLFGGTAKSWALRGRISTETYQLKPTVEEQTTTAALCMLEKREMDPEPTSRQMVYCGSVVI